MNLREPPLENFLGAPALGFRLHPLNLLLCRCVHYIAPGPAERPPQTKQPASTWLRGPLGRALRIALPRLRILGSQGGPRRPRTLGPARRNRFGSRVNHSSTRIKELPKLSTANRLGRCDFAAALRRARLSVPASRPLLESMRCPPEGGRYTGAGRVVEPALRGAPPAMDGTTSTRSPSRNWYSFPPRKRISSSLT